MTAVKLFKIRRGERTFRRLDEGNAIRLEATIDDLIIIGFSGVFDSDVIINGDLTVNGTTTTINSVNHVIADNKIVINNGEPGAGVVTLGTKAGLTVDRGSLTDVEWCWDETRDIWTPFGELLGDVADPTLGIHVGDRDFNDARYLQDVVDDTTPQLGGNLDNNNFAITTDGNVVLSFASGGENAVNWVDIEHATTGSGPIIRSVGADSNIDLNISSKGTGTIFLNSTTDVDVLAFRDHGANSQQWTIEEDSASATNDLTFDYSGVERLRITPSGTVDGRDLAVDGSKLDGIEPFAKDDQDLWLTVAGDSGSTLASNSTDTLTIAGAGLISTVMSGDILTVSTTATSNPSALDNIIEDTTPQLGGNLDVNLFDLTEDGNVILSFESAGELAVNWIDVENALTGAGPTIRSVGANTNIDLNISAKGTGIVNLGSGGVKLNANLDANGNSIIRSGNIVLSFAAPSEFAVNWIDVENADTGLGPTLRVKGTDTNVDLNIEAKGLGRVNITNDSAVAGAFVNDALDTLDVAVTTIQGLHYLGAFTVAGLPSAAANTNRLALATDASPARSLVVSNGSDWHVFASEGPIVTT